MPVKIGRTTYYSTPEAELQTGLTEGYLRRLCRGLWAKQGKGKLGTKIGRNWHLSEAEVARI